MAGSEAEELGRCVGVFQADIHRILGGPIRRITLEYGAYDRMKTYLLNQHATPEELTALKASPDRFEYCGITFRRSVPTRRKELS
jgi:hypothetical protein